MRGLLATLCYYNCLFSGRTVRPPLFNRKGVSKMQSRRASIVSHYYRHLHGEDGGMIKASAAERRYKFQKPGVCDGAVVRIDLNGYSDWTQSRTIVERANLLNAFFTKVVDCLDKYGGIYFRDEGDCIVAIFSSYFETASPYVSADAFCKVKCYF